VAPIWGVGGFDSLGVHWEEILNGFEIVLKLMNLLMLPGIYYIVRQEKRLTRIETILDLCLKNKVVLSEK